MSASLCLFILVVFIQRNSEAAPAYDDIPSGYLKAISGVVPASVPRSKLDVQNKILKEIRRRVDQVHVSELDSSIRDDISQDQLSPQECIDKYGIRDGTLKHIIRGIRDVGGVLVKDVERLGQGKLADLPLVPNVIHGIGETLIYTLCGVEDAVSDFINDGLDEGADILTKVFVNLLDIDGTDPLQSVPAEIMKITKLLKKVGPEAVEDIFHGVEYGAEDLADEVGSGVLDVVSDVKGAVNIVETDVMNVVTDVKGVVNGVQTDVSSVVNNAETDVSNLFKDVKGAVSGVETDVTSAVNAVDTGVQMIKGGVGSGVGNIVGGLKGGLGTITGILG